MHPLLAIRAIFGLFEGVCPPAAAKAIAIWFPKEELGRANGIKLAATQLAPALAPPLVAFIVVTWGWRAVFYVLLIPGAILAPLIRLYMRDSVSIGAREPNRASIGLSRTRSGPSEAGSSVADLIRMPSVLWCSATLFFANVANWGLMNWLPTYFLETRGLTVAKMGLYAALPYAAGTIGYYLGGHIGDKYFADHRRVPVVVGLLVARSSPTPRRTRLPQN